jgi:hypothetical protein
MRIFIAAIGLAISFVLINELREVTEASCQVQQAETANEF